MNYLLPIVLNGKELFDVCVAPFRVLHLLTTFLIICALLVNFKFFSAPEPKAQVHYCDHALSVVRRPSSLTFHIFDFFSETTKRNSTKLDRK